MNALSHFALGAFVSAVFILVSFAFAGGLIGLGEFITGHAVAPGSLSKPHVIALLGAAEVVVGGLVGVLVWEGR